MHSIINLQGNRCLKYITILLCFMADSIFAQPVWKDTTSLDGHSIRIKRNLKTGIPERVIGLVVNLNRYGPVSESGIQSLSRQFLQEYAGLLNIDYRSLRFKRAESWRNRLHIEYEQHHGGVPVYNADIKFTTFENGNIPIVSLDYFPDIDMDVRPTISPDEALEVAVANYTSLNGTDSVATISGPELFVLPLEQDEAYIYFLAYKIVLKSDRSCSQTYFVEAHKGEVIAQHSNIRSHTRIYGYITQEYWPKYYDTDEPVTTGFIRVNLTYLSGGFAATKVPSSNGYYEFTVDSQGRLLASGIYFVTYHLQDAHVQSESRTRVRVENAQGNMVLVTNSSGQLYAVPHVYFSDHVSVNNTRLGSAPNVYYHLDRIRKYFKAPPFNYHGMNFTITANLTSATNYPAENDNGTTINFGRLGGYNWGGLSDVVYHEYTHSLTWKLYGEQTPRDYANGSFEASALDEGMSDYFSSALNEDSEQGEHTVTSHTPRDLNNALQYSQLDYLEVHFAGTILGGACWDLREALNDPGDYVDLLAFEALREKPKTYPEFAEYLAVADDDDGNLNNGYPHYYQIKQAFETNHGIPVPDPLPLSVSISGPSSLDRGEYGTWTSNVSGGHSPYNYAWYKLRDCDYPRLPASGIKPNYIPCGYWFSAGGNSPTLTLRLWEDHRIKVVVTDNINQTATATKYVRVGGGLRKQMVQALPETYALAPNHPNPFNPATTIRYDLPQASNVSLVIYDIAGREVRSWNLQESAGYRQVVWDGKYRNGQLAPTGLYIYRLVASSTESDERFTASRKMVLMK